MDRLKRFLHLVRRGIPYFVTAFLLFACIGFLMGWEEREKNALSEIYANVEYGRRADGRHALQLTCEADGRRYHFLVESNTLVENSATLEARIAGNPSEQNQALRTAALAFFGGPMGAISYKTAWETMSQARRRPIWLRASRLVGGILGGISGYALGYWQGSHWRIGCDSDMGRYVIINEAAWQLREHYYFHMMAQELAAGESARMFVGGVRNANQLDDGPFEICETPGAMILNDLETVRDPGREAFDQLLSVVSTYERAADSEAWRVLDIYRAPHAIVRRGSQPEDSPLVRALTENKEVPPYSRQAFDAACSDLAATVAQLLTDRSDP